MKVIKIAKNITYQSKFNVYVIKLTNFITFDTRISFTLICGRPFVCVDKLLNFRRNRTQVMLIGFCWIDYNKNVLYKTPFNIFDVL